MGDMLFMAGGGRIQRVHGPFVSDEEVELVVDHLKTQGAPEYLHTITEETDDDDDPDADPTEKSIERLAKSDDPYEQATIAIVMRDKKASTSYIQRRLGIGYNRAALAALSAWRRKALSARPTMPASARIADGKSVVIGNRKLKTWDIYPLNKTPLKLLLGDRIDLSADMVRSVKEDPDLITIVLGNKTIFGDSTISLMFDPKSFELRQWTIRDAQGKDTSVMIFNVQTGVKFASNVFTVPYDEVHKFPGQRRMKLPLTALQSRTMMLVDDTRRSVKLRATGCPARAYRPDRSRASSEKAIRFGVFRFHLEHQFRAAAIAAGAALPGDSAARRACACRKPSVPMTPFLRPRSASSVTSTWRSMARRAITASPSSRGCHCRTTSGFPIARLPMRGMCRQWWKRRAARRIRVHNFYVPAGGDEPDRDINPKFAHKLDFIEEMRGLHAEAELEDGVSSILVGDLNIAPLETDVWSHKQLLKVVSHTPVETENLTSMQQGGAWVDLIRAHIPPEEKIFTWWSYRARDWDAADRGRRLDHVWSSADLAQALWRRSMCCARRAAGSGPRITSR
jgi:hypothetical protein